MSTEERADDLIKKFELHQRRGVSDVTFKEKELRAKACAEVCVNEVLDNIKAIEDNYDDEFLGGYKEYWNKVLSIIKNHE